MVIIGRITLLTPLLVTVLALGLPACGRGSSDEDALPKGRPYPPEPFPISSDTIERSPSATRSEVPPAPNAERTAWFGDLHVHTTLSLDAFAFGTTVTPRDAYRYALGEAIEHPAGFDMQLRQPLDFYAVTDHALFLGLAREAADTSTRFSKQDIAKPMHDLNADGNRGMLSLLGRVSLFRDWMGALLRGVLDGSIDVQLTSRVTRSAWLSTIEAADEFYDPGVLTTFVAFEYTPGSPDGGSLHRNVIFRDSARVPAEPFSRYNSRNPEGLWDWMDGLRRQGIETLAIPHNSNGSNGQMFKLADWAGNPLDDDYAERRVRNEPLVEITQVKGTSETHPTLSDTDEWADFEIKPFRGSSLEFSEPEGSYVRQALREGIAFEQAGIVNPFKLGFVGASDTHTGATPDDEANFHSKVGLLDATPQLRGAAPLPWWMAQPLRWLRPQLVQEVAGRAYVQTPTRTFGASGLTGVWAEENTRTALYDAFRRKETFATSGPRIRVRFFADHRLDESSSTDPGAIRRASVEGVPMGGDLRRQDLGPKLDVGSEAPRFLAQATRDASSAPLQRLQIVKGWTVARETFERVYDVACSDGATPDEAHRCPDNGAQVDSSDCSYTQGVGAGELIAVWQDPDFDPDERAFYYVRALENPTCRWSTWDAVRMGVAPRPDLHATLQERAWSSPIWYTP